MSADGDQPVASPTPAPEPTDSLPLAMQRRDDEVTSLVHRDAPSRPQITDGVERDDIMVVEASLVPERRAVEDDAGNAAAHADQEHRARILARGGNHSAIRDARERMLARRTTPASPDAMSPADEPTSDPADPPATDDPTAPVTAAPADTASFERTSTPDDAPIRPLAPRPFGGQRPRATAEEDSSPSVDDDDRYNSVPPIDPTIDLPLANAAEPDRSPSASDPAPETADPTSGEQVTVYDAVLERARAIRAATGREPVLPAAHDRIPTAAEEAAREEKRARRRITTVPPVVTPPAAPASSVPAEENPNPVRTPQPASALVTHRPQPAAVGRRPAGQPVERKPAAPQPAPRMGIAIAAIKQEAPKQAPEPRPQPQPQSRTQPPARALDPSFVRGIDFHRVSIEDTMAEPERAPGTALPRRTQTRPIPRTVPVPENAVLPSDEDGDRLLDDETPFVDDDRDDDRYMLDVDVDEEPLAASRRGPFGRFRNPWRKDREAIRERQVMASVRDALAGTGEYWEEPFAEAPDEADRDPMPPRTTEAPASAPAPQQLPEREREPVVAYNNVRPAAPRPATQPERPQGMTGPAPSRPVTPGRANGLYRPVHEGAFRDTAADVAPDYERVPAPSARNDRFDRGNGATVLRVRADAQDDPFDDAWTSPEAEPLVPAPRRPAHRDRVRDAFRPLDAPPYEPIAFIPDLPEPELQMELVEPAPPVSASPWSFEPPVDLDSIEGMDAFRGRLFGDAAVPRRTPQSHQPDRQLDRNARPSSHRPDRQPGDDVVLDVPPRAEVTSATERSPLPPKDSPLRSANYRPQEAPPSRQTDTSGISRSIPERRQAAPQALSRPVDYREEPRAGRAGDPDPAAFDIREVLTGARDPIDLGVSIAPDIPRACRTCRDFRPSENGERGFCANNWAFTHRQMVNADDLPCQSTIGCWWLPSDRVWMPEERNETSAHRVDALLPAPRRARSG